MRLELDLRARQHRRTEAPKILRIAVSVGNLHVMLAKFDDSESTQTIRSSDVRWYTPSLPGAWFRGPQTGWTCELFGRVGHFDRLYWWQTYLKERLVRLFITRCGAVSLLGERDEASEQPRDYETSPWDRGAPLVICETDEVHNAKRVAGRTPSSAVRQPGAKDVAKARAGFGVDGGDVAETRVWPELVTNQPGHSHPVCPRCGAELCDGLILRYGERHRPSNPARYAELYGWPNQLCFSRLVGIEGPGRYDGVSVWLYPCCGLKVDRFTRKEVIGG